MTATQEEAATTIADMWDVRLAAGATVVKTEEMLRRQLGTATVPQLVELLESFSPTRARGPQWTRSFEQVVERIWAWCDEEVIAAAHADFQARGPIWMAVANSLSSTNGEIVRRRLGRPSTRTRLPKFSVD